MATVEPSEPSSQATTFATTEHFTLRTARAATIAKSNGRANIFLGAVSGAEHPDQPVDACPRAVMTSGGLRSGRRQPFLTTAGMIKVLDAVLSGAVAAFVLAAIDRDQVAAGVAAGGGVGATTLTVLHLAQSRVWGRTMQEWEARS